VRVRAGAVRKEAAGGRQCAQAQAGGGVRVRARQAAVAGKGEQGAAGGRRSVQCARACGAAQRAQCAVRACRPAAGGE